MTDHTTTHRTICIYHANCADGFTAAWAVREALGASVEFIPAGYGDAPPDVTGADVIIVDFSYKRPVIDEMAETCRTMLLLDHHKTAAAELAGIDRPYVENLGWNAYLDSVHNAYHQLDRDPRAPFAVFDMSRSGAQLAWDFFHGTSPDRPSLVDYVADRDLWKWEMEDSRQINAVIGSHDLTWDAWDKLDMQIERRGGLRQMAMEGAAILRAHDKLVRSVIDTSKRRMVIAGHNVPVAAAPYALASDVAGTMAEGEPFAATYVDGPKGRAFSLRSRGDGLDVSQIAATFGGGGHRNAAGFLMPLGWEGNSND